MTYKLVLFIYIKNPIILSIVTTPTDLFELPLRILSKLSACCNFAIEGGTLKTRVSSLLHRNFLIFCVAVLLYIPSDKRTTIFLKFCIDRSNILVSMCLFRFIKNGKCIVSQNDTVFPNMA
jgi:hypothetical protein